MKKNYSTPQADILCFCPVERLATIDLSNMRQFPGIGSGRGEAVETSKNDIQIKF